MKTQQRVSDSKQTRSGFWVADNRNYPPFAALRAFEAIGRLGGIRRAAKELAVDHAVVSRHIQSLESWVGMPLVVRNGRGSGSNSSNRLTERGEIYYKEIYAALKLIASATGKIMSVENEKTLFISCSPGIGMMWLADRIDDFTDKNPGIEIDFRPSDVGPDFRSKGIDVDIRYVRSWEEASLPRSTHRFELARPSVRAVASPEFAASLPPIWTAEDLLNCTLLHEENDSEWVHWLEAQGIRVTGRLPGHRLWHAHLTLAGASKGRGIALANRLMLKDDLETGKLVEIKPRTGTFYPVRFGGYVFMAREDRWNAPLIACFRRWLQDTVSAMGHDAELHPNQS